MNLPNLALKMALKDSKKLSQKTQKKPIFELFLREKQKILIKQRISRDLVANLSHKKRSA